MASVIKFYRGLKSSYDTSKHADGIYFATDTHEILLNGESYSGDVTGKVIQDAQKNSSNGVIVTYTDGTSYTIKLDNATESLDGLMSKEDKAALEEVISDVAELKGKIDSIDTSVSSTYSSNLDDSIETINALGGIAAGTSVASLNGKTYDEILDTLIFPTVNPTIVAPSAKISLKSTYNSIQEVGASAPTADNFTVTFDRGSIKIGSKFQNYRSGELVSANSYVSYNNSSTLPEKVVLGTMSYKYHAAYAAGPQPLDSKGGAYSSALAAGSVDSSAVSIIGCYPVYYGILSDPEGDVKSLTKSVQKVNTNIKVSGPVESGYICVAVPNNWSAISSIKDSNSFDVAASYETKTVSVTTDYDQTVNYTVYISNKMSVGSGYYVNFN